MRRRGILAVSAALLTATPAGCDSNGGTNLSARADEAPERYEAARQEAAHAEEQARRAEAARTRGRLEGVEER